MIKYKWRTLARQVMVVATYDDGENGEWCCYIDAVPGKNPEKEFMDVTNRGTKIDKKMAGLLFPSLAIKYTWRI